jgi:hypothetical protein
MDGCYEGFRMGVGVDLVFLYRLMDTLVNNIFPIRIVGYYGVHYE